MIALNELFFIDDEHKKNYERFKKRFPIMLKDKEYQSACYISSLPVLFSKFEDEIEEYQSPVDWIVNWQMKNLPKEDDESDEAYEERSSVEVDYDLTNSMQQLGCFALNLFNGYEYFNLMDCLNALDDKHVEVLKVAIDVRLGVYKGQ